MGRVVKVASALAILGGILAGIPMVAAHHAMVMYDNTKTMTLDGTLVELRWTNPHVFLRVEVKEAGQSEVWVLETSSPTNLVRLGGWSETAMKPGDRVKVDINPHRSEQRAARVTKVVLVDTGQEFGTAYRDALPPRTQ
jgi:Family of unknown function (DUF6152)